MATNLPQMVADEGTRWETTQQRLGAMMDETKRCLQLDGVVNSLVPQEPPTSKKGRRPKKRVDDAKLGSRRGSLVHSRRSSQQLDNPSFVSILSDHTSKVSDGSNCETPLPPPSTGNSAKDYVAESVVRIRHGLGGAREEYAAIERQVRRIRHDRARRLRDMHGYDYVRENIEAVVTRPSHEEVLGLQRARTTQVLNRKQDQFGELDFWAAREVEMRRMTVSTPAELQVKKWMVAAVLQQSFAVLETGLSKADDEQIHQVGKKQFKESTVLLGSLQRQWQIVRRVMKEFVLRYKTQKYGASLQLVASFLHAYSNATLISTAVPRYRRKVIAAQRQVRRFFTMRAARMHLLSLQWIIRECSILMVEPPHDRGRSVLKWAPEHGTPVHIRARTLQTECTALIRRQTADLISYQKAQDFYHREAQRQSKGAQDPDLPVPERPQPPSHHLFVMPDRLHLLVKASLSKDAVTLARTATFVKSRRGSTTGGVTVRAPHVPRRDAAGGSRNASGRTSPVEGTAEQPLPRRRLSINEVPRLRSVVVDVEPVPPRPFQLSPKRKLPRSTARVLSDEHYANMMSGRSVESMHTFLRAESMNHDKKRYVDQQREKLAGTGVTSSYRSLQRARKFLGDEETNALFASPSMQRSKIRMETINSTVALPARLANRERHVAETARCRRQTAPSHLQDFVDTYVKKLSP